MSKIPGEEMRKAVKNILAAKGDGKFVQTIDLQIKLRNYDAKKDKRFAGSIKLPHDIRHKHEVCVLGDKSHCDEAKKLGIAQMDQDGMKKLNKAKKPVKKLATKYRAFLASESLIKQIPRILGPGLSKYGKFPTVLLPGDDIAKKVAELKKTVKFQFKKEVTLASAVGHTNLTEDEIVQNINSSINYFVSLLKKNWQNIGTISIKSTHGKPQAVYPIGQIALN
jgi:large subunit ribosomal protein L10Ae